MERSDYLYLLDDKMIPVNENTSQPKKQESKKWVLSHRTIWSKEYSSKEDGDFAMNLSKIYDELFHLV